MSTVYPLGEQVRPRAKVRGQHAVSLLEPLVRGGDLASVVIGGTIAWAWSSESLVGRSESLVLLLAALLTLNIFSLMRLYHSEQLGVLNFQLPRVSAALAITFAVLIAIVVFVHPAALPGREWFLAWMPLSLGMLFAVRIGARVYVDNLRRRGDLASYVLLLSTGDWGRTVRDRLSEKREDACLVGCVEVDFNTTDDAGLVGMLRRRIVDAGVEQVLVALAKDQDRQLGRLISILRDFPVEVSVAPEWSAPEVPVVGYKRIGGVDSMTCLEKPIDGVAWTVKNVFDRVLAVGLLVGLAPLLAVIALAVKFSSPGPILFRQKRFGFNQQMFEVFKFRTMYVDVCDTNLSKTVKQATKNDPRVTAVGRFLRRSSLDELPQLFNVLLGTMSLVGPRPHAIAHDEYYGALIDGYVGRHRAKPGITGWAQVNGYRGEIHSIEDMRRRVELDLYYIDNWSLWFDIRILFRTAFVCLRSENAY